MSKGAKWGVGVGVGVGVLLAVFAILLFVVLRSKRRSSLTTAKPKPRTPSPRPWGFKKPELADTSMFIEDTHYRGGAGAEMGLLHKDQVSEQTSRTHSSTTVGQTVIYSMNDVLEPVYEVYGDERLD